MRASKGPEAAPARRQLSTLPQAFPSLSRAAFQFWQFRVTLFISILTVLMRERQHLIPSQGLTAHRIFKTSEPPMRLREVL
jgi:hypothetical protein